MAAPRYTLEMHRPPLSTASARALVAFRLAREFPNKPPTVEVLRDRFGMSRACAYRWIAAWREGMR